MDTEFKVGQRVSVTNPIDYTPDYGIIIYIETNDPDGTIWLYIQSDVDKNNIRSDPKFVDYYWIIRSSDSPDIGIV